MFSNNLTPAEIERLAVLAEELGESIQVIGKILRHGYASVRPEDPKQRDNREQLHIELGDVLAAIQLMRNEGDISHSRLMSMKKAKLKRIDKFLHHNKATATSKPSNDDRPLTAAEVSWKDRGI